MTAEQAAVRIEVEIDPFSAWKSIANQTRPDEAVCVTGSIFLVAELRRLALESFRPRPIPVKQNQG
jgi:folylpolyglutamate synthase/dihydropteroate synthase